MQCCQGLLVVLSYERWLLHYAILSCVSVSVCVCVKIADVIEICSLIGGTQPDVLQEAEVSILSADDPTCMSGNDPSWMCAAGEDSSGVCSVSRIEIGSISTGCYQLHLDIDPDDH